MSNLDRQPRLRLHALDRSVDPAQRLDSRTEKALNSPGRKGASDADDVLHPLVRLDEYAAVSFIAEPIARPMGFRFTANLQRLALQFLPPGGRFCRIKLAIHKSLAILADEGVLRLSVRSTRKATRIVQRSLGFGPEVRKAKAAIERIELVQSIGALAESQRAAGGPGASRSRTEITHLLEYRCQACRHFHNSACSLMKRRIWRSSRQAFINAVVDPTSRCPKGLWPDPDAPPISRLNLVYFVYPMRHPRQVWQWNVAELLKRLHVFSGRRIITVATDGPEGSAHGKPVDPPEAVIDAFAGHDVEFRIVINDPRLGEAPHFLPAMREIASTDPSEAVFYAHAKGVSRQTHADAVRAWTAAMYHHNLDRIEEVADLLRRWPCAGIAKWYGFPEAFLMGKARKTYAERGGPWHGWHFAGTFWWVRHDALFSRPDWEQIEIYNYATEKYLANFFRADEAFCLAYDRCEGPYELSTWTPHGDPFDPAAYALQERELKVA